MAEKVILTDKDNKSYMPITRGELVLDSSGNPAFTSEAFLATLGHHGLLSATDKKKIDDITNTTYTLSGGLSGNNYQVVLTADDNTTTTATISSMVGASIGTDKNNNEIIKAGSAGLVPAPTNINTFLKGDGTWSTITNSLTANKLSEIQVFSFTETKSNYCKVVSINITERYRGSSGLLRFYTNRSNQVNYKADSFEVYLQVYQQDPLGVSPVLTFKSNNTRDGYDVIGILNISSTSTTFDLYVYGKECTYHDLYVSLIQGNLTIQPATSDNLPQSGTRIEPTPIGNADTVDSYHADSLVRKWVMENNSGFNANDLNTDLVIYTSKGDVGNNTSVWDNFGAAKPAGGFSLFHIKEGACARQLLGVYNDHHLYTRSQYYSNGSTVWSDWSTIALISDITKSQVGLGNVQNTAFYKRDVTVNGTVYNMAGTNSNDAFGIYAPTTAGTAGQVLVSKGSGAPNWANISYNDLTNRPTIPTVGNGTITITQAGTTVGTFSVNQSTNATINLTDNNTHWTTRIYAGKSGGAINSALTNPYIKITDDYTFRNQVQLKGSGTTTVSSDSNGVITINSADNNYYHTRLHSSGLKISTGTGVDDMYVPIGTTSNLGVVKQHKAADCITYTSDEGATTPAAVKKAISTFVSVSKSLTSGTKIGTITINGEDTELYCQTNTDTQVTQTNSTTKADYRVLLSGNANDTTETNTSFKSSKLKFNPGTGTMSVGGIYSENGLYLTGLDGIIAQSVITSKVGTGKSPFIINSTTVNEKLNADMVDGYNIWTGTKTLYNSATKNNNTIYIIHS